MGQSARANPAIRIVAVPSTDADFVGFVRSTVLRAGEVGDLAAIETRLRTRYPRARVHPSELSGRDAVAYAYRDGRWEPATRF